MAEQNDTVFLAEKFDTYYGKAKSLADKGLTDGAKRYYKLAVQVMLELAEKSSPELKKARVARAKRIIEIADNLEMPSKPKRNTTAENAESASGDDDWTASQIPDVKFSDIAGLEDVKDAITIRMIYPAKYPELYELYKKQTGGGVLLYGPPGTGKTMIAKAIAHECGATFYAVKGSDIVSKWVGESEQNINKLFESARNQKLSIIFIDEVDALLGKRGEDKHNDRRVNEFLQAIDGFVGKNKNLLLLGATNRPWDIDMAALRSGRFSEKIYVPLPDKSAREFMFNKYTGGIPLDGDVSIGELVKLTDGYSGADINEICDNAKVNPLKQAVISREKGDKETVIKLTRKDFISAVNHIRPSVNPTELALYEAFDERGVRAAKNKNKPAEVKNPTEEQS